MVFFDNPALAHRQFVDISRARIFFALSRWRKTADYILPAYPAGSDPGPLIFCCNLFAEDFASSLGRVRAWHLLSRSPLD